jgi:hypothetical protein
MDAATVVPVGTTASVPPTKPTGERLTWYMGVMPVPPAIMDSLSMDLPAPSSMYLPSRHAF